MNSHPIVTGYNVFVNDNRKISPLELDSKPDFQRCMERIEAWFNHQVIDRPPVRFTRHNAEFESLDGAWRSAWKGQKDRWFDVDYQLEKFLTQVQNKYYHGETFPVFWPNLGPNVFAGLYGCPLEFAEVTSWGQPILADYDTPLSLNWRSEYLLKLIELTHTALELCPGKFLVGYTDLHPGLDWLAALRGAQATLFDLLDFPERLDGFLQQCSNDFLEVYDFFDAILKEANQPSVTWMAIPAYGRLHIPSSDFSAMISPKQHRRFAQPWLEREVQAMTHNIFHVDGKGVANQMDLILELPNVQALQWVQGVGDDAPIMQWVPLIRRIQAAGKSVVVDLTPAELEDFIGAVRPEGILLCLASENEEEELAILRRLEKWR